MPLFVCDNCGIVDNTALTNFWAVQSIYNEAKSLHEERKRIHWAFVPGPTPELPRYLCSACDPESPTQGRWHGQFPAWTLAEWGYVFLKRKPFVGKPEWEDSIIG